jgi:chloramphenicol 3-O-phosphotransferase
MNTGANVVMSSFIWTKDEASWSRGRDDRLSTSEVSLVGVFASEEVMERSINTATISAI